MSTHPRRYRWLPLLTLFALVVACGDGEPGPGSSPPPATAVGEAPGDITITLDGRPFRLYVPPSYTPRQPVPLVVGLHGYTSHSAEMESYFGLIPLAEQRGFLYARPDGTVDRRGEQFWNGTDACCDLYDTGVDDSAYLRALIETVRDSYDVSAVFLIGHSNGGFMAHRMACDHADLITGIAALAGVVWHDPGDCTPSRPLSVLQIHGTADDRISYTGGSIMNVPYPGAEETVARWRSLNGCTEQAAPAVADRDLDRAVTGAETVVTGWHDGCGGGSRVELWQLTGSAHVPTLTSEFTVAVVDFFYSVSPA